MGILPNGKFLAIEVKSPIAYRKKNHNLSLEQISFLQNINKNNGVGVVADSIECVKEKLIEELGENGLNRTLL